ncbi:MAG: hypothetical protein ACXVBL_09825, partial [Bdellovibrionota bacterium]
RYESESAILLICHRVIAPLRPNGASIPTRDLVASPWKQRYIFLHTKFKAWAFGPTKLGASHDHWCTEGN